ncbi:hypothetical protein [Salibacterium halotolerans]|uniref:Uncharacterized protein n=1 Tax=Salibacterium halotolerans TaxID=1884432 RepID=A0A1I5QE17_9BACI|nr:hypothetical protein [Salibacterium halotolerans]SFP44347.1 hypothetical protein SAMN05518683_105117 [Salibacterium halotolerans]
MLKAVKEKVAKQDSCRVERAAGRIENPVEKEKQTARFRNKEEEKWNHFLHQEIETYLYTIHPSFLLHPDAMRALHNRLLARSKGRRLVSLHVTSEVNLALDFYQSDLTFFLEYLEKKGFQLSGNEERLMKAMQNKLSENNYYIYFERFGDFAADAVTLEKALLDYLETAGSQNKYGSGRMDFLVKYLINKELLNPEVNHKKMRKLVKSLERRYAGSRKTGRPDREMSQIS